MGDVEEPERCDLCNSVAETGYPLEIDDDQLTLWLCEPCESRIHKALAEPKTTIYEVLIADISERDRRP